MIDIDLDGRVAVVTGGSRGIGRACVEMLASAGVRCVVGYHEREADAEAVIDEIGRLGGEAVPFRGDLTDPIQCREIIDTALRQFGALHFVVNNAGRWRRSGPETMTEEQLVETVGLNLEAAFRITRHAAKAMRKEPAGGSIIQIASTAAGRGEAHYSHYAATRGALVAMARSLARELAPRIRVNVVSPGWVDTEMSPDALEGDERRRIESSIPLGRVGRPADVAGAVLYLCSELASWVTGAVLPVNGGGVMASQAMTESVTEA